MNPCDNCKKKPNCLERCFPKMDYERGKGKEGGTESMNRLTDRTREDAEKALEGMKNDK